MRGGVAVKKVMRTDLKKGEGEKSETLTLPLLYSIHAAFFFASVTRAPAIVALIVSGGMCCSPGPRVRALFFFAGVGSEAEDIWSPGRTTGRAVAMVDREKGRDTVCRRKLQALEY